MILNSRMYDVALAAAAAWRTLIDAAARQAGITADWVEHAPPAPIRDLWARDDLGCVFMCGLPWATWPVRPRPLAVPVPALARYGDRPVYFSEFLVHRDAPAVSLEHTFGGRLACMPPESNSGYNAPRHHLMSRTDPGAGAPYRPCRRSTPTPPVVIAAVAEGVADVGVVDSYVLDLLRVHRPSTLAEVRTIAVTDASPIPLLVASPTLDSARAERLQAALCGLHDDVVHRDAFAALRLARFERPDPLAYDVVVRRQREADAAGFRMTAGG